MGTKGAGAWGSARGLGETASLPDAIAAALMPELELELALALPLGPAKELALDPPLELEPEPDPPLLERTCSPLAPPAPRTASPEPR